MNLSPAHPSNGAMRKARLGLSIAALIGAFTLPVSALESGSRAPEIGLRDTQGRPVRMSGLRGKVVLVDFWASWCEPCREELPVLQRLYERYRGRGLVVVGVNVDRQESNMRSFIDRFDLSFPVVHDSGHQVAGRYDPNTMPTSFLVDRNGIVRYVHEGFRSSDAGDLEERIRSLLGSGG